MSEKTQVAAISEELPERTLKGINFKLKRNTSASWKASNPTLEYGEPGVELRTDDRMALKIGNGVHQWNQLQYVVCAVDDGELT